MAKKKHTVDLSEDEREELESFVSHQKPSAQDITRARVLLRADEDLSDPESAEVLDFSPIKAQRARKRYHKHAIAGIHRRDPDREYEQNLDGEDESHLIALACDDPPEGPRRWTLRLLADELVALEETDVESVSHETIRKTLKKSNSSHTNPSNELFRLVRVSSSSTTWKKCSRCIKNRTIQTDLSFASTNITSNLSHTCATRTRQNRARSRVKTTTTSDRERKISFSPRNRSTAGEPSQSNTAGLPNL